jgi:hypothetical protein
VKSGKKKGLLLFLCTFSLPLWAETFFANGIKIGEVTEDSALIWTRLTRHATAHVDGVKFRKTPKHAPQTPAGKSLTDMEGAVPGIAGSVQDLLAKKRGRGDQDRVVACGREGRLHPQGGNRRPPSRANL